MDRPALESSSYRRACPCLSWWSQCADGLMDPDGQYADVHKSPILLVWSDKGLRIPNLARRMMTAQHRVCRKWWQASVDRNWRSMLITCESKPFVIYKLWAMRRRDHTFSCAWISRLMKSEEAGSKSWGHLSIHALGDRKRDFTGSESWGHFII